MQLCYKNERTTLEDRRAKNVYLALYNRKSFLAVSTTCLMLEHHESLCSHRKRPYGVLGTGAARAVPTPWLCKKTMISRTAFCSAQAVRMLAARTGPIPATSRRRSGVA